VNDLLTPIWNLLPVSYSASSALFFAYILIAAMLLICVWGVVSYYTNTPALVSPPNRIAYIFTFWVMATIMWGGYFGSLRVPGVFDLTLERAIFIVLAIAAAFQIFNNRVRFDQSKVLEILIFLFLCLCLLSMTIHGFQPAFRTFARPWFIFIAGYFFPAIGFLLAKYFLDPERDYPVFLRGLFYLGAYISIVAILENYKLTSFVFPRYIVDPDILLHLERARGPFLNSAINGLMLGVCFVAGVALIPITRGNLARLHMLLFTLYFPAIYFTRTRSVYLLFLVILGGIGFAYRTSFPKWKLFAIPVAMCFFILAMNAERLTSEDRSAGGLYQVEEIDIRFDLMNKSLFIVQNNPLFGIGLAQFRAASLFATQEAEFQHNHLMGIAAELGFLGLLVYLCFLGAIIYRYIKLTYAAPEKLFINTNFILLLGLVLLANLINNTFLEPSLHLFANLNLFIFAGMVDRLYNKFVLFKGK
jgi:hypothetical protein